MDVACEDMPVERVSRPPPHEVGSHSADQGLQRPHPGPLSNRVAEGGLRRGQIGHEDVIHVAAVVHDKHHRRLRLDGRQRLLVGDHQPHPVEQSCEVPRDPVADSKVEVGVERGHDLVRITFDPFHHHLTRHAFLPSERLHRIHDTGVVNEPVDQHLALCELEGLDLDTQALSNLLEDPADPPADKPADARNEQTVERRQTRKNADQHQQPKRHGHHVGHRDRFSHDRPYTAPRHVVRKLG